MVVEDTVVLLVVEVDMEVPLVVVVDMVALPVAAVNTVVLLVVEEDMAEAHLMNMVELLSVADMAENLREETMVEHLLVVATEEMKEDTAELLLVVTKQVV